MIIWSPGHFPLAGDWALGSLAWTAPPHPWKWQYSIPYLWPFTSPSSCGFRSVLSSSVILITPSNQASCKWNISKCWSKQFQDLDDTFLFHHQIIPSCNHNYSSSSTERWIIINTCQRTWQSQIALTWASFALLNFRVENKESLSRTWTWM